MDNPMLRPSAHGLQRPQVFVKVEFGVSWTGQHPPHRRGFEFKSRALRERNPDFPRHVPGPTTNDLAATSPQQFQMPRCNFQDEASYHHAHDTNPPRGHTLQSQPPHHAPSADNLPHDPQEPRRGRSRHIEAVVDLSSLGVGPDHEQRLLSSGERHERGSSAPPPLSDNKWDVVQQQSPTQCTAGPSNEPTSEQRRPPSDMWKELPEVPTRFRLGEEGLPWESNWTFPMGFEPFLEPDPYLRSETSPPPSRPSSSHERSGSSGQPPAASVSRNTTIPLMQSPQSPLRADDPDRRRELEALGSAMMTVDNGFETQWWNQDERGERRQLAAVHPPPATEEQVEEQMALGWVGALLPNDAPGHMVSSRQRPEDGRNDSILSPESSAGDGRAYSNMVVSPISTFSAPTTNLSRSMSTRSDELWFAGRYA